ncbi:MAG: outer membrane protein assembly factor BamA, partial [Nitrospirae bacterium]
NIRGNVKTRDKVIRREIRLDEGDVYNNKLVERSKERIYNLRYFDTVNIKPIVREKERLVDLDVEVKERLTGMLSLGGGYSSRDKLIGMAQITETNLFGRGLYFKLRGELSSKTTNYSISIQDPWLFDRPISGSFSIFNEEFEFPAYKRKTRGFSLGLGKEFTEFTRASITYRFERERIKDVDPGASIFIREQEGKRTTSSLGTSLVRDSRNNVLDPTRGSKNALYTTVAGIGGNNKFYKFLIDSGWYFPYRWDTAFHLRGRFGYADGYSNKKLPLDERFYVGGINTVRGINFGEAGPRDENGEKIGGDMEIIFNAEYIFPLVKSLRLKGVVFFDAGAAYDRDNLDIIEQMTRTAGAGVRWISPFGLVRLEWGHNLSKRKDQETNRFEFAFGSSF